MTNEKLYNVILSKFRPEKVSFAWTIKDLCIDILASMFQYDNLPDSIKPAFIERYLILNGSIGGYTYTGRGKYSGDQIVSVGCEAEQPDVYGVGEKYIATTENGFVTTFTPDIDGAVIYNNRNRTPDIDIINLFTDFLCEEFVSLKTIQILVLLLS